MLFSTLQTLLLWLVLSFLIRNKFKAGLATSLFVVFFFSYGRLFDLLEKWDVFVPSHGHLLPGILLVWGYCVYFIKTAKRDFRITTKNLNKMAVVLVLVNLFTIAFHEIGKPGRPAGNLTQPQAGLTALGNSTEIRIKPDIYYIILDEYAHPDTMAQYYSYDNSQFTNYLVDKGFFIARGSRTVTVKSQNSIATSLNMEYLPADTPPRVAYQMIAKSKVADFLRSRGYKYIYIGSFFDIGRYKVDADLSYNFYQSRGSSAVGDFSSILLNTTMFKPFYNHLIGSQYLDYYQRATIDSLAQLKKMPGIEGPKFVFIHLMLPHANFVFGPEGEPIDPINWSNFKDKQFYLGQYVFANKQIENVVSVLLQESSSPPVIIIQSDHGIRPRSDLQVGIDEWQKILNAYYLPDNGKDSLYDSISPANSFRLIFNLYFGADYDLLEDLRSPQYQWVDESWKIVQKDG